MPGTKLYVGNLYCMANKDHLRKLFSHYGRVSGITMIEGTGYGYVEMNSVKEAVDAKKALDGADFLERVIRVRYADEPQYVV
ncbi:RNA recognition motif domain-containing protein [Acidobacteriota bacterium]